LEARSRKAPGFLFEPPSSELSANKKNRSGSSTDEPKEDREEGDSYRQSDEKKLHMRDRQRPQGNVESHKSHNEKGQQPVASNQA
jgi:hypothetical protein